MSTLETLKDAAALDVRIRFHDGQLTVDAPRGILTPELTQRLKQAKPDLLRVSSMCQTAAHGLQIEPETLFSSLDPVDVELLISGNFSTAGLRCYAESLATGIKCGRVRLDEHDRIVTHFNFVN